VQRVYGIGAHRSSVPWAVRRTVLQLLPPRPVAVLDIGAGRGRFADFFLSAASVRRYVAVEPYRPFCRELTRRSVEVLCMPWEEARLSVGGSFDVVIFWNVIMFMPADDYTALLDDVVRRGRIILFSMWPVKRGVMPAHEYIRVARHFESKAEVVKKWRTSYVAVYRKKKP